LLFFQTYSTFLCRPSLYIEDLFILPEHRGKGYGKKLLTLCLDLARERGCGRVEWAVLDWNTAAQDFYKKSGAKHLSEWHLYRVLID
jgi:GNAT superfamily N-acetyltransferase